MERISADEYQQMAANSAEDRAKKAIKAQQTDTARVAEALRFLLENTEGVIAERALGILEGRF